MASKPAPMVDLYMVRDDSGAPSHGRVVVIDAAGRQAECALRLPELRDLSEAFGSMVGILERRQGLVGVVH
jgi:hypothetical protein